MAEAAMEEADLYASLNSGGESHTTSILYGGAPALINSAGVPWTAAYIDSIGDPACDLRSNIAAESRAKIVYERLINCTDDPGVKDALNFLMTREVAHQKSFEKALYAMEPNFPAGKLVGLPAFADKYYDMSQGEGDVRGPWNEGEQWEFINDREQQGAVDGGDGSASVSLGERDAAAVQAFAARTASDLDGNPVTGADLGAGPGAGTTTELIEDEGVS
ncbi:manganese catalase family protein [Brevundimonas vesicularis]|uniref:manganese catalase family protein n=2 Tax=Brevundimonas TaxID=41275 RepID=UPI0020C71543|nr:manganese catalase family protein [Brevundimonas vesicularis]